MIRQRATVRVLCGLILCGLMTSCSDSSSPTSPSGPTGDPTPPTGRQTVDRVFELGLNQSASILDGALDVTFRQVLKDERCPGDAMCVAGVVTEAMIQFDAIYREEGGARPLTFQLSTQTERVFQIGRYTVYIEQLAPYRFVSLPPIKPEDWRATIRITSAMPL